MSTKSANQQHLPWWPYAKAVTKSVFTNADTMTIRLLLANASFLWALGALHEPTFFDRPMYAVMSQFGNQYVWSLGFILHFIGVYWRIYDPVSRPFWGLLVNGLGFVLWSICTIAINSSVNGFSPTTALECTLCVASGWALYRTGFDNELTAP